MKKLQLTFNILLRRLTVLQKLVFIGLLLGVPLSILLVINLNSLWQGVEFAEKEKSGISFIRPLSALKVHILEHKSFTFAGGASKTDFQSHIAALNSRIKDEFDKLIKTGDSEGANILLDEETLSKKQEYDISPRALQVKWEKLLTISKTGQSSLVQQEYDKLINDFYKLMKLVAIKSKLILDPEGDSYYLMDVAVLRMPKVQELLSNSFYLAIEDEQDTVYSFERLSEIIYLNRTLRSAIVDEIPGSINSAIEQDPEFHGRTESLSIVLPPMVEKYRTGVGSLIEIYENIIRNNKIYGIEDLTLLTSEQLDESLLFWTATLDELEKVIDTRINTFYISILFRLFFAGASFVLALIFIYFTAKGIIKPVYGVAAITKNLAEGNINAAKDEIQKMELDYRISGEEKTKDKDEIWNLFRAVRSTIFDLEILLGEVGKAGIAVTSSVTQITSSIHSLNAAINEQAASTAEVNATGKEIHSSSIHLSRTVEEVADKSGKTLDLADTGVAGLNEITGSMASLEEGSKDISEKLAMLYQKTGNISNVITAITKIATQTNLLSLNASIEAEKAGEYGAGFSIVAAEIKRLAEETAMAALEIEEMIHEMQQAVKEGVVGVEAYAGTTRVSAGRILGIAESINEIIQYTKDVLPSFEVVSSQMHMQTDGAAQISDAMNELNAVAVHTRESISEFTEITTRLDGAVRSLREVVSKFKFGS